MVDTVTMLSTEEELHIADGDTRLVPKEDWVGRARQAQHAWSALHLQQRLAVIRATRHLIAENPRKLAAEVLSEIVTVANRNQADTLVAEVLPIVEACRFLEREAASILRARTLGRAGRPLWLRGVKSEIRHVPLGVVLVIAPSNYPLFLPGVQALQALAAGNAVLWKPAPGGERVAWYFAELLRRAGLPKHVLQVLDASIESGIDAIRSGVDKVVLTGHANTGRAVMREAAETLTPSIMELSGCDALFILPGADLDRVAAALAFGLRLNGSATCMAPRRVFATQDTAQITIEKLSLLVQEAPPVTLSDNAVHLLDALINDAAQRGATVVRDGRQGVMTTTTILSGVTPADAVMCTDIFAPLLAFCYVPDEAAALQAHARCPYALTAAVFGPSANASSFASKVRAGTVLINDLIVSTADPRVPFGGVGASGFGVTRGREGLLEMTATKTIIHQTSRSLRPYAATGPQHEPFFASFITALHAGSIYARAAAWRSLLAAARTLGKKSA